MREMTSKMVQRAFWGKFAIGKYFESTLNYDDIIACDWKILEPTIGK